MEHRAGIEPANTGFADPRVSHFATGAYLNSPEIEPTTLWSGWADGFGVDC